MRNLGIGLKVLALALICISCISEAGNPYPAERNHLPGIWEAYSGDFEYAYVLVIEPSLETTLIETKGMSKIVKTQAAEVSFSDGSLTISFPPSSKGQKLTLTGSVNNAGLFSAGLIVSSVENATQENVTRMLFYHREKYPLSQTLRRVAEKLDDIAAEVPSK